MNDREALLMVTLAFDLLLGTGMLVAAFGALWSRDQFRAVVLFVVFGLLVALAWIRLQAPDVALAEAAIGAGLTGALFLDAIGHLRRGAREGSVAGPTAGDARSASVRDAIERDGSVRDRTAPMESASQTPSNVDGRDALPESTGDD